jgi:nitroreductase
VDGGLFSQQLMLAIHAHGLVCCPLNLAVTNDREQEIRKVAGMLPDERLIMMVSFGYAASESVGAASARETSEGILRQG